MTDERLAELRALSDAATPGPWGRDDIDFQFALNCSGEITANMVFCVTARTAIPELLDTIDRVRNLAIKALRNGTSPSEGSWCSAVSAAKLLAVLENRPEREEDDELDALDGILDDHWSDSLLNSWPSPSILRATQSE